LRPGTQESEQGPRVKKIGVVRVILDADEIKLCAIRQAGQIVGKFQVLRGRIDVEAEQRGIVGLCVCHIAAPALSKIV